MSWGRIVAVVEALCGIGIAAWFSTIGMSGGGSAFPFVVAAAALVLLGTWSVRSWRSASPPPDSVTPPGVWVTALPAGTSLAALPGDWEWVDEQQPYAAGEDRVG